MAYNPTAMKLLLFDLDGTILLTGGAGLRGMEQAGVQVFGERFSLERITTSGGLDPLIYAEALRLAGIEDGDGHHELFRDTYMRQLEANLATAGDRVHLLPGIEPLLGELRRHERAVLGLVTGNYTTAVPIKLRAVGVDPAWFEVTAFGDEASDRPGMVRLAIERHHERFGGRLEGRDVIIIGDTPNDVNCAHANGCLCLGVATGMYSEEDLRRAGADVVVPDLSDPRQLYEMMKD